MATTVSSVTGDKTPGVVLASLPPSTDRGEFDVLNDDKQKLTIKTSLVLQSLQSIRKCRTNYNGQGSKTDQSVIVELKDLELKFHVIIDVDSELLTIEDVQLPKAMHLIKANVLDLRNVFRTTVT